MSADRRRDVNAPGRPLMPRLAAANNALRTPPAPKLAGYDGRPRATGSPALSLPASSTTSATSAGNATTNTAVRNGLDSTPSPNITPRSAARRSRPNSVQSTPYTSLNTKGPSSRPISTLGIQSDPALAASQGVAPKQTSFDVQVQGPRWPVVATPPHVTSSPAATESPLSTTSLSTTSKDAGSYFFFASDANNRPVQPQVPRAPQHKKTSSFVYANGAADERSPGKRARRDGSFDEGKSATGSQIPPGAESGRSWVSSAAPSFAPSPQDAALRAPSPPRQGIHLSYRKGASQIIRPAPLNPPTVETQTDLQPRQISLDSITERQAQREMSNSSGGSGNASLTSQQFEGFQFPPGPREDGPNFPQLVPSTVGSANGSIQALPKVDSGLLDFAFRLQSPTSPHSTLESHDNASKPDAAANARRERKLLDLEISNSSLLAINKSLEKEARKQKAEIRRLRRMSRYTARYSILSQATTSSGGLSVLAEDDLSGISDNELESMELTAEEEEEEEDEEEEDSIEDGALSPGALEMRDARHRKGDQRRLRLDLAKHKELLADSQRMNQSLRRCMEVTEQLIKDGQKALEYQVQTNDIRLGGRVLSPEEQDPDSSFFDAQEESFADEHAEDEQVNHTKEPLIRIRSPSDGLDAIGTERDGINALAPQRSSDTSAAIF